MNCSLGHMTYKDSSYIMGYNVKTTKNVKQVVVKKVK